MRVGENTRPPQIMMVPIRIVLGGLALACGVGCIVVSKGHWLGLLAALVCSGCGFALLFLR